ncbi:hypothetical protein ONA70_06085 [Micromonospora yasonensis]|uniref:hypothetical protein n=1 Tax=Micromonospora yasonensis TaxID=1128667 RepID=UPI0022325172|nr:hypothetical protein [Micromonospora yasonensis]MCW3839663.1 hypothetical protein [Micromonospora yasonensis]
MTSIDVPPYRPRPVSPLGVRTIRGWRLKAYGIAARADTPRPALVYAVWRAAAELLPEPDADGAHGLGFVVAHDARPACFALVDWWVRGYDLYQRYLRAPLDRPDRLRLLTTPTVGCVWELAVVQHEREAWIRHVLRRPAEPDVDGYLADVLTVSP